jgi:hypothetical protein
LVVALRRCRFGIDLGVIDGDVFCRVRAFFIAFSLALLFGAETVDYLSDVVAANWGRPCQSEAGGLTVGDNDLYL